MLKTCAVCGAEFETIYPQAKCCCTECAKIYTKRYNTKYVNKRRAEGVQSQQEGEWIPIPSLGCRYEMNQFGTIRNAATKQILTTYANKHTKAVVVYVDDTGKRATRAIQQLLWETHGILPKRPERKSIPVTIKKGVECRYFPTMLDAAKFLAPRVFLSLHRVREYFKYRKTDCGGWQITYHIKVYD